MFPKFTHKYCFDHKVLDKIEKIIFLFIMVVSLTFKPITSTIEQWIILFDFKSMLSIPFREIILYVYAFVYIRSISDNYAYNC